MLVRPAWWRLGMAWLTFAVGVTVLLLVLGKHLPWSQWLFPRYAGYWLVCGVFVLSSGAVGWALVSRVLRLRVPVDELAVYSFAVGFFVFLWGWTILGLLRLMNSWSFALWPALCLSAALPFVRQSWRPYADYVHRSRARRQPLSGLELALIAFGICATLLAYAPILTPQNIAFDARWYHLPIAERYALEGGIVRFSEGWMPGAYPQFASILYSWAFCSPFERVFDRVVLSAHLEFTVFLLTLASIPVLCRSIAPKGIDRQATRVSWVAVYLFPQLFVYDSSLNGGADHILTFWAVPLALATFRAYRSLELRIMIVLALIVCALALTKFTAFSLMLGPALLLGGRAIYLGVQALRRRGTWSPLAGAGIALGLIAILTSVLWLKNILWYDNPVFPMAVEMFPPRPWTPESYGRLATYTVGNAWEAERSWAGVLMTLKQLYQFSFIPNDWETFHRDWPMFGFLFTLTVPIALILGSRRLVFLTLSSHAGILFWYWTFHQDRYLQSFVPWMAAGVALVSTWAWKTGWVSRGLLGGLIGLQVAWGLDAPFFGTHAMSGQPLKATIDLLAGGFGGRGDARLVAYPDFENIGEALPEAAVVLRHENQTHLGLQRRSVDDWFQTGISWGAQPTLEAVDATMRSHGITHMMWIDKLSRACDSHAADIHFFYYATFYGRNRQRFGGYTLAALPETPPEHKKLEVLYLGCDGTYEKGLYDLTQLNVMPHPGKRFTRADFPRPKVPANTVGEAEELARRADVVVYVPDCMDISSELRGATLLFNRGADRVYATRH